MRPSTVIKDDGGRHGLLRPLLVLAGLAVVAVVATLRFFLADSD